MGLKIAFVMDPFETLDSIDEDTSCCLIAESLKRDHSVYYLQVQDLELQANKAWGNTRKIVARAEHAFTMQKPEMLNLDTFHAIFMRKDPPFNLDYLYATYILEYAVFPLIINHPQGIRSANEKLYPLNFPEFIPRSLVSKNPRALKKFLLQAGGKMVVKPLNNCSGKEILYVEEGDMNVNSILEIITREGKRFVMGQEFLPRIRRGDKRVLLLEGKPLGALRRVPAANDYRANIHRGATYLRAEITEHERHICQSLSDRLQRDGIYFAGIDLVDEKIIEINVTSPAGIPEINQLEKTCLEKIVIDWLERKVAFT